MGWVRKEDVLAVLENQRQRLIDLEMYVAEHILIHYAIRWIEEMPEIDEIDSELRRVYDFAEGLNADAAEEERYKNDG